MAPAEAPLTTYESACSDVTADTQAAIRDVLNRIGDKWSLLVIATLSEGTLRFTELLAHVPGISQRMLTLTLRQLERDGLVSRAVFAEVPPRVEYALTERGTMLKAPAGALAEWAIAHYPGILASREEYDARA